MTEEVQQTRPSQVHYLHDIVIHETIRQRKLQWDLEQEVGVHWQYPFTMDDQFSQMHQVSVQQKLKNECKKEHQKRNCKDEQEFADRLIEIFPI